MKDYLLLFRGGLDYSKASPEQLQQSMQKWRSWMDGLAQQGKLSGGQRLEGTGSVVNGTKKQVSDGPFAEGKEVIGGYIAVKANTLDEAIEIAKGSPIYDHDGSTEVREIATM